MARISACLAQVVSPRPGLWLLAWQCIKNPATDSNAAKRKAACAGAWHPPGVYLPAVPTPHADHRLCAPELACRLR